MSDEQCDLPSKVERDIDLAFQSLCLGLGFLIGAWTHESFGWSAVITASATVTTIAALRLARAVYRSVTRTSTGIER